MFHARNEAGLPGDLWDNSNVIPVEDTAGIMSNLVAVDLCENQQDVVPNHR